VSTRDVDVKVLGTTFNVRVDSVSQCTNVSLLEGKVAAYVRNRDQKVLLRPMQNLRVEKGSVEVTSFKDKDAFLWRKGILSFDKWSLGEIAQRIEWYYNVRIIIHGERIKNELYSGKFSLQDGPYEILRVLQKSGDFRIWKEDAKNVFELE
jgi:ferric-dicitrate binding protein FerR (iron transport regulator)